MDSLLLSSAGEQAYEFVDAYSDIEPATLLTIGLTPAGAIDDELRGLTLTVSTNTGTTTAIQEGACGHRGALQGLQPEPTVASLPPGCRTGANDFMFREQQPMFPFDAVNILGANTGGGVCSGGRNQAADGRSESGTCAYSSTGVRGGKGPVFAVGSGGGAGVAADGAAGGGGDVRSKKRSASRGRGRDGLGVMSSTAKLKPRPRITSTATKPRDVATAKASLRTEADIQGVVDEIKSRNQNNGGGRQAKGGRWTAEEDDTLRNIVSRDGEGKWKEKSEELNYVMASHYEAMAAVAAAKSDHAVQQYGRAAAQCLHRWKKVLQPGLNKRHWTPEEDEIVRGTVLSAQAIGTKVKWSLVAVLLPGRLGKQCRERWFNHLDPTVKKTEWTPHEDEVLFNAQAFFGTRWCEISKFLPGRTENAVKNRFNSSARQKWFSGQPQANGRPVNKKAASKAFLDRLMDTLGKDGGGGYDGNGVDGSCSGSKRIMERSAKPTQPNPFSGQLPPSALLSPSSPASKLAKRQRVQLPGLLSQQNTGFLGSSSLAGTHTGLPYTTNDTTAAAAPAAAGTRHAGFGGGTGTGAGAAVGTISTDDELSAAILTGDKREKKKQQVQKQSKRNHKRRSERAGSMVTVALRVRNSRGGKVSRHVMKNSSPHGPRLGVPAALAVPSSQHENVMGSYGKREPEAAGAAGISGTHEQHPTVGAMSCLEAQGGVRSTAPGRNNGKSAGLAGGSSAASSPSDPSATEEHDRRSCAPWLPGSGGIPQWGSVSGGDGFSNQRYGSAEETTFAAEAIANKIKANIGREDETLTQAAAAAAVAAVKTEAAQRYLRGEWTLTSQRPLPLSCGTSIPQFHPYFELATKKHSNDSDSTSSSSFLWAAGTSDSSPSSPPVFASALGGPNSNSSRTSSTSKLSRSGAFHDCSSQKANDATPSNKTVERQTGISVNTNGSPPPLCTPELATDHNNNHITTTTNNSSSRSSSHNRAESFLEDFLLDDTNSPGLPFAPSEVLGLGRRVGLGNDSRSSSATSMMMMMMFGVGVGASGLFGGVGVSPAVADSTVHNGNNGDIRPAAMMPNNQRASSGSGDGGSSTGISSSATGSAGSGGVSSLPSSPSTVASARTTPITVPIVPRVQGQEGSPPTVWQASNEGRQAQTDPTPEPFIGSSANGHRPQGMAPLPVPFTTPVPAAGARSSPPVGEAMTALSAASPAIWTAFSSSPAVPPPFSWQGVRGPIPPSVTASTVVSGGGGGGGGADHGTGKQHQRASPGQKAVTDDAVVFPSGASGASGASLIDGQQQQQSHLPLKDQVPSAPATPHSGKGGGGGGGGIDRGCDLRSRSTASLATPSLPTGAAVGALTPGGGSGTPDGDEVNATSVDQDPDTNGGGESSVGEGITPS